MSEEIVGLLDGAIAPALNNRLFGHEAAEAFLAEAYRSGKMHHAILIEGPEGIGKATLAFRFAHHLLRHADAAGAPAVIGDPDLASPLGRQLASGASHNLLHLKRPVDERSGKAKTAITVDEVRRAGHFFAQTSGDGNWRIVIIDPADDMNRNAANAVLKLLEEPPRRAMFLVLSHAPGKLLATIRSRCQTLRLEPLRPDAMDRALDHLGLSIAPAARDEVLALANGSVARALKVLNYGGGEIINAFHEAVATHGPEARRMMHKLADALSAKDSDVAFGFFVEYLEDFLIGRARSAAFAGDLPQADRLARLGSAITEKLTIAGAYNLDRKQTVIELLGEVAASL